MQLEVAGRIGIPYYDSMALRPMFPFYGSKWRARFLYPRPFPLDSQIIEPFAGSGCYSLAYPYRNVWLNDLDPTIYELWDYLIKASCSEILSLPIEFEGEVSELKIPNPAKSLIGFWMAKAATKPASKLVGWGKGGAFARQYWGEDRRLRVAKSVERIKHWKVTNLPYQDIPNVTGTWFVDPPYQGVCGRAYEFNDLDFTHLANWCQVRKGQTIVCEGEGADWLPFKPLGLFKNARTSTSQEMIWTKDSYMVKWEHDGHEIVPSAIP